MNILVLHASENTNGVNDATGAFVPESVFFNKHRTAKGDVVQVFPFKNTLPQAKRFAEFCKLIEGANDFDAFVYLGHGLRNSLPSAGVTQGNRKTFTDLLIKKSKNKKKLYVTLFACSTAETTTGQPGGEGGFADKVRDDLVAAGMTEGWIDAHPVPGHATQNSLVKRFFVTPEEAPKGGVWLVAQGTPEFTNWKKRLNSKWKDDPFRFDFPYLTQAEVLTECKKK